MELERDVEQYLILRVGQLGGLCLKQGQEGWPDRIVILPDGKLIWVELKRRTGKLADLQQYRAYLLRQVGQQVEVAWTKEDVDSILGNE